MADANTTQNETDGFEAVTSEAVVPKIDESLQDSTAGAQDDTSKGDKDAPENADDAGADAKPRKGRRFQKRIDRLTRAKTEAERRAEQAERRLKELEQGKGEIQAKGEQNDASDEEPDPANFDSYDDYLDAFTDWKAGKKPAGKDSGKDDQAAKDEPAANEGQDAKADTEFTEAVEDVQEAFEDTRKQHPDFDEVIGQEDLQITRDMVIAMAEADDPGAIAYHLGKNKEEAARIAGLSATAQVKEIGKLEAKLATPAPKPGKKTTEAPDPIEPVKGSDSAEPDPAAMPFNEYERKMNEKERGRGTGFW